MWKQQQRRCLGVGWGALVFLFGFFWVGCIIYVIVLPGRWFPATIHYLVPYLTYTAVLLPFSDLGKLTGAAIDNVFAQAGLAGRMAMCLLPDYHTDLRISICIIPINTTILVWRFSPYPRNERLQKGTLVSFFLCLEDFYSSCSHNNLAEVLVKNSVVKTKTKKSSLGTPRHVSVVNLGSKPQATIRKNGVLVPVLPMYPPAK